MSKFKVAIDKNNNSRLILFENEKMIGTSLKENEILVDADGYVGLIKPFFKNGKWIEGATEEEIKAWQEKNRVVKEVTEQEKLNSQLLQANAQQLLVNASLLKQIAELQKGGN